MIQPRKYKAKDVNGDWVTGWYAELHIAEADVHDNVTCHKVVPSLFNDEPGERGKGGYWHTIQPDTLKEIKEPKQLSLF